MAASTTTREAGLGTLDIEGRPVRKDLAAGAIGLRGVLFLIVTGAAPITAMLFNVPVAVF